MIEMEKSMRFVLLCFFWMASLPATRRRDWGDVVLDSSHCCLTRRIYLEKEENLEVDGADNDRRENELEQAGKHSVPDNVCFCVRDS